MTERTKMEVIRDPDDITRSKIRITYSDGTTRIVEYDPDIAGSLDAAVKKRKPKPPNDFSSCTDSIPDHYRGDGGVQPWDIWRAFKLDAWEAAAVKYLLRAGKKGPALDDYRKALHYLQYLVEREEERGHR